jgi:hypothetical protein
MKILLIPIALAAMLTAAFAQSDNGNKLFGAKQDAARQIDYTIGTFVNDYLTIRIAPALIGARVSSDDIQRPSYQISLIDETGTRQTVIHRQGEKLFGEIQEEGTTFRFWVEPSKDALVIMCDGEKFTFKRVSKFPTNPFGRKLSPGKPNRN